jgi:phosphate-selective porin OprO/OprP
VLESVTNGYYGLGPYVKLYGDNWHLGASVTGDQLSRTDVGDDSVEYNVRGHWNPVVGPSGFIHLGSWYYFQKVGRDTTTANTTATIATDFNSNLVVSPGSISNPHRDQAYGYEFAGVYKGLWTYDEYGRKRIETVAQTNTTLDSIDHKATTLAAGWLFTGEKPGWDRKNGTWGGTTVLNPVTRGGWGGWELAFRFDKFDYGDAPKGSVAHSYTGGINWYLTDWSRVMFEYIDWHTDNAVGNWPGPDSGNTIGLRAQLVF